MDIIILLLCTFFIVNRLIKILGQYDEEDKIKKDKKSFVIEMFRQKYQMNNNEKIINPQAISTAELSLPDNIQSVFRDIRKQDNEFDFDRFINGTKKAYTMYIKAKIDNDQETLKNLFDPDLATSLQAHHDTFKRYLSVSEISQIIVVDAALFGDRAMVKVMINSKEIHYIEDENGNLISGSRENNIMISTNITFCRYISQEKIWRITRINQ